MTLASSSNLLPNLLSIDVEEWWSVHSFQNYITKKQSLDFNDRISQGINKILLLLDHHRYKATFFILGRVAEKHPQIVEKIIDKGHDLGSHGYSHKLIYNVSPSDFEKDLKLSIDSLKIITGEDITKYRAPSYSITKKSLWALDILINQGIKIDSSIIKAENTRFGIKNAYKKPHWIKTGSGKLLEIPPNVVQCGKIALPITSGFAFRLFPLWFIKKQIKNFHNFGEIPNIIIHNWELDPEQPKIKTNIMNWFIHYYNIKNSNERIDEMFRSFKFSSYSDLEFSDLTNLKSISYG